MKTQNLNFRLKSPKGTKGSKMALVVLLFCATFFSAAAQTKESDKLKRKQRELQKKIENTKNLIGTNRKQEALTITELAILNQQIAHRDELIQNYSQQVSHINNDIVTSQNDIIKLQSDLAKLKQQYIDLIRYAYRHRNSYHRLLFVFASESFNQAYIRVKYLKQFADYRKKQALRIRQKQTSLNSKITELTGHKNEKQQVIGQQKQEKQNYLSDKNKQQDALSKLKTEEQKLRSELNEHERDKEKLAQEINRAIKEEMRKQQEAERRAKAPKNNTKSPSSNGSKTGKSVHYDINTPDIEPESAEFEKNRGRLPWPVEKGEITSSFGRNAHPTLAGIYTNNNGIDIGTSKGSAVRCVFNGKVSSVFVIPNAGKCVVISHGAYRTVYANLAEVNVSKGQEIKTKQQIGSLLPDENNGSLSQAHFEIWKITESDMEKQNPALWLYR